MQDVKLKVSAVIDGAVRQPAEGTITVSDDDYDHLFAAGAIETDEDGDDDEDGLEAMTLIDLNLIVTKEGVPLNGATRKADVIAAIRDHRHPTA